MNTQLTARMDSLIKGYEEEMSARARQDAELQQEVRMRSANIIAGILVIGVGTLAWATKIAIRLFPDLNYAGYYS